WLDRLTYGLDSATAERFRKLGKRRFLDEQLAGRDDALPAAIRAQVDAFDITRTPAQKLIEDEFAARARIRALGNGDDAHQLRKQRNEFGQQALEQAAQRELLRAAYSPAQLKQQMRWFWLNHFNVYAQKGDIRWLAADYAESAIGTHALGKFRDLVMATLTHP